MKFISRLNNTTLFIILLLALFFSINLKNPYVVRVEKINVYAKNCRMSDASGKTVIPQEFENLARNNLNPVLNKGSVISSECVMQFTQI